MSLEEPRRVRFLHWRVLLKALALVCFVIVALADLSDLLDVAHPLGLIALGQALWVASEL